MRSKNNWEIRVEKAVLDLPKAKLGTYGRLAYVVLCGFADRQGRAFPKIDTIADGAACSRASVNKGLHELEALGLIKRSAQVTKKGQCSNEYQIFRPSEMGMTGICETDGGCLPDEQRGISAADGVHVPDGRRAVCEEVGGHTCGGHPYMYNSSIDNRPNITAPERTESLTEIISLWNEILVPHGVAPVRQITDARRKLFEARVSEDAERQSSSWWREFFGRIAASEFLISNGAGRWLTFDWALDEKHFVGIIEGKYDDRATESAAMYEELPPEEHERENERAEIFQLMFEAGFPGRADYRPDVEVAHRMGMIPDELYQRAIRYIESEEARRHG